MSLFRKNKKELKPAPLGYWEKESFMLAIPRCDEELNPEKVIARISENKEIKVNNINFDVPTGSFKATITYDEEEYEVNLYFGNFFFSPMYIDNSYYISSEELDMIAKATKALTISLAFKKDIKKSFHFQIKLAYAALPNLLAIVDESAERILPSAWVQMVSKTKITPGPENIFHIHAVTNKKGDVWLHTHGLCRCLLTELEILDLNNDNYNEFTDLISAYASYLIDNNDDFNPWEQSVKIGMFSTGYPIVVICKLWTIALNEYKKLSMGNAIDREKGHNSKTSVIFVYKNETDEENKVLSKVTTYGNLWKDNPIYYISNEETFRKKNLAIERFNYVKEAIKDIDNMINVKIALPFAKGNDFECIWFRLISLDKDTFKASLLQKPYNVNMEVGEEKIFTLENLIDWEIYTNGLVINPSNVYILDIRKKENNEKEN